MLRFHPPFVGRGDAIHAWQESDNLESLQAHFYGKKMFGPWSATFLLRYFAEVAAYSASINKIVVTSSLLYPRKNRKEKGTYSPQAPMNDDASRKRKSFESKLSILGRKRHNQLLLSDESILVLTIMKHVADVSD